MYIRMYTLIIKTPITNLFNTTCKNYYWNLMRWKTFHRHLPKVICLD